MPQKGQFAEYLGNALWTAYGPLLKTVGLIAVVAVVVIGLAAFWSKASR